MAANLEPWTERTPAATEPPAIDPSPEAHDTPGRPPAGPARERGPFLTYLFLPWSYGERDTGELWHRFQCRLRRHEIAGGHTMQVGGTVVFIERSCRWCGAPPADLDPDHP